VSFNHRDSGTPEADWAQCDQLTGTRRLVLPSPGTKLIVLAAHPDDETLGAGGLVAMAAEQQCPVEVVIATDGEGSHPASTTHSPSELAIIRRREATAAVAALAPRATVTFLGLPDGHLTDYEGTLSRALHIRVGRSSPVWLVTPWRADRHPDHEICSVVAQDLAGDRPDVRLLEFPIWVWHWARPVDGALPWSRCRRLELTDAAGAAKRSALGHYRSQSEPLSERPGDEAILTPHTTAHFSRTFEIFIEVTGQSAAAPGYFDELYADNDDPWGLAQRFYETRKRDLIMASLPRQGFRRAFEPGCAVGLLSERLAERCDEVIATDVADRAVELARTRLAAHRGVTVELGRVPDQWPEGEFDLIALSEVGYYCPDLAKLSRAVLGSLARDGVLLACHWRHPAQDHPHTAEQVHSALGSGLRLVVSHLEEDFRLDVWSRNGDSVARADGVVA